MRRACFVLFDHYSRELQSSRQPCTVPEKSSIKSKNIIEPLNWPDLIQPWLSVCAMVICPKSLQSPFAAWKIVMHTRLRTLSLSLSLHGRNGDFEIYAKRPIPTVVWRGVRIKKLAEASSGEVNPSVSSVLRAEDRLRLPRGVSLADLHHTKSLDWACWR